MSERALLSRQSLAERWDFESTAVIEKYEKQGIIARVPKIPYPRYSVREIEKIESTGNFNPFSPSERRRLEDKVFKLEKELEIYKNKIQSIRLEVL